MCPGNSICVVGSSVQSAGARKNPSCSSAAERVTGVVHSYTSDAKVTLTSSE